MQSFYHSPVMLTECLDLLALKTDGIYVDLTFGGGGHSSAILSRIDTGMVIAFDQDQSAKHQSEELTKKFEKNFMFVFSDFRYLEEQLGYLGIQQVDGILADLGVSSYQIDTKDRGFSTRFDGKLDMRMNENTQKTATTVVNEYSEKQLSTILKNYGEIRNPRVLARKIVEQRSNKPFSSTGELSQFVRKMAPVAKWQKYVAQVFQAIRIEVNDELGALEEVLPQCNNLLKPKGRLVVISYHSLEDRLVKRFMLHGNTQGKVEKDFYGNDINAFRPISRKPMSPSKEEIERNGRARSAKLRAIEKK